MDKKHFTHEDFVEAGRRGARQRWDRMTPDERATALAHLREVAKIGRQRRWQKTT